jgi:hypothetical protein
MNHILIEFPVFAGSLAGEPMSKPRSAVSCRPDAEKPHPLGSEWGSRTVRPVVSLLVVPQWREARGKALRLPSGRPSPWCSNKSGTAH